MCKDIAYKQYLPEQRVSFPLAAAQRSLFSDKAFFKSPREEEPKSRISQLGRAFHMRHA